MRETVIVYITDDKFAMPTTVSITSLVINRDKSEHLHIYVILDGVSESNILRFQAIHAENVRITLIATESINCFSRTDSNTINWHVTSAATSKFFLPQALENESRVIYIDGDTLIQKSLSELYNIQLQDCYVAVVKDFLLNDKDELVKPRDIKWKRDIEELCPEYFNSGVMLLNLQKMREDGITDKLVEYRNTGINYYMDQDAFNVVCSQKKKILNSMYNFQTHLLEWTDSETIHRVSGTSYHTIDEMVENAVVLHCCGSHKPWQYYLPWTTDLFRKYYYLSPYSEIPLVVESLLALEFKKRMEMSKRRTPFQIENTVPSKIIPNGRLVLYGAGKIGHIMNFLIRRSKYANIVLWVDENYREVSSYMGEEVMPIDRIKNTSFDQIFITLYDYELVKVIRQRLIEEYDVNSNCIVTLEGFEK